LSANFRSRSHILESVNAIFSRVMVEASGLQPAYAPLSAAREPVHHEGLEFSYLEISNGAPLAEESRAAEASLVADWIANAAAQGTPYSHIALLFRSANAFSPYLDALKEKGIRYLAEGEKFFFQTQEVTEFLNLLAAVAEPRDTLALAGVARSVLGGLSDVEIFELHRAGSLDYTHPPRAVQDKAGPLFAELRRLHAAAQIKPVGDLIRQILDETFAIDLFARSGHGEQSVANLLKIARLADKWANDEPITLKEFIRRFEKYRQDEREEGENPLADVNYDAVKIMTIHKAKGLEFPIVILPNLSADSRRSRAERPALVRAWERPGVGVRLPRRRAVNGAMVLLEEEIRRRDEAEEVRVFYVASTRAKERMIFVLRSNAASGARAASFLKKAGAWPANEEGAIALGPAQVPVLRSSWTPQATPSVPNHIQEKLGAQWSPTALVPLFQERVALFDRLMKTPLVQSPSALQDEAEKGPRFLDERISSPADPAVVGTLCHKVLENWEFSSERTAATRTREAVELAARQIGLIAGKPGSARAMTEAEDILAGFFKTETYQRLSRAKNLKRELDFVMALAPAGEGTFAFMRGRIDILFEESGKLVVGDYKTSRVDKKSEADSVASFAEQSKAYRAAVEQALGRPATFRLIFLRTGKTVDV
jgi:ATP-dependent helicase/nuclease subunit A